MSYRDSDDETEILPISLWDTYSAFANCYGGVIILGVKEEKDGSWRTNGTFRRNFEGDYHCTRLQVKAMLRDQTERTMDGKKQMRIGGESDPRTPLPARSPILIRLNIFISDLKEYY